MSGHGEAFSSSEEYFSDVVAFLDGPEAAAMEHAELESAPPRDATELFRRLTQDHVDLPRRARAAHRRGRRRQGRRSPGCRSGARPGPHHRFRRGRGAAPGLPQEGQANLHPADGVFNLPAERHSHGLRAPGRDRGVAGLVRRSGRGDRARDGPGARQAPGRAARRARGRRRRRFLHRALRTRRPTPATCVVLSCDGKGIVMRPEALREQTKRAAESAQAQARGPGCRRARSTDRKRMAEVGAVYDVTPAPRTARRHLGPTPRDTQSRRRRRQEQVADRQRRRRRGRRSSADIFDEAERRDPAHDRRLGRPRRREQPPDRPHQGRGEVAEGRASTIVIDVIHVLEYLWKAAWCFFDEGDAAAEEWVRDRGLAVLDGRSKRGRRRASAAGRRAERLSAAQRARTPTAVPTT